MVSNGQDNTKRFIRQANHLKTSGVIKHYADIVDAIKWDKTALSNVMNGRRPIPDDVYQQFSEVYRDHLIEDKSWKDEKISVLEQQVSFLKEQNQFLRERVTALEEKIVSNLTQIQTDQTSLAFLSQSHQEYWLQHFLGEKPKVESALRTIQKIMAAKILKWKAGGIASVLGK